MSQTALRWWLRSLSILVWCVAIVAFLLLPNVKKILPRKRSINVYCWTEFIDQKKIAEFEHDTGISVNIAFYESNEELYAKLKMTKGVGFDLIFPSDFMISTLAQEGLLQKLDHTKLPFIKRIRPVLLDHHVDPHNEYSLPYFWSFFGIGVNTTFFKNQVPLPSWRLLFDTSVTKLPRVFLEQARELFFIVAYYKYHSVEKLSVEQLREITNLLISLKPYVVAYADVGVPYLLISGQAAVVLAESSYVLHTMVDHPEIALIFPQEGTFISMDNAVIPAACTNQDLVYQFLNYLYRADVMAYHCSNSFFFPALADVPCTVIPGNAQLIENFCEQAMSQFQLFKNVLPEQLVNKFWTILKIS